ncbi:Hydrolase, alpha/beta fold family [Shewanella piezotolerans WP3]|uniref:Hydrolase, alpha/beta fold family n=1 Tax=Shewanella piezotolerans (strain WP3 / JCM 13877) TaxID=225849 RepID=B0FWK7_SHEPW|nr:alpha/beta fold hydrolase [Shewanella piezotolerans]ABY61082.1 lipase [Shewanella piezotolerans WP3]ACJ29348.1 Hydrolase, alpha/beta fold family [Shewanella piezotolerans WP3]
MHYTTNGNGPVVILIHGLFGDLDNLKALGKSLEDSFTVVRVDVANHGSSKKVSSMTYLSLAEDIKRLIETLKVNSAILVGHSMGGKIAMATALSYPGLVNKLVVADIAPVSYNSRHDKVFEALESMPLNQIKDRRDALEHMRAHDIDEGTAQFLLKSLVRRDQGFKWKMNLTGLKQSYSDIISWPTFTSPYQGACLFIRGGDSDYVTSAHRNAIIEQFPTVKAKTIEGTGHWLHAQKASIFNRMVKDFITNK